MAFRDKHHRAEAEVPSAGWNIVEEVLQVIVVVGTDAHIDHQRSLDCSQILGGNNCDEDGVLGLAHVPTLTPVAPRCKQPPPAQRGEDN